jgi:hypothetical protein
MKKLCLALFLLVACKSSSSTTSQPSAQPPTTEPTPAPAPTGPAPVDPTPAPAPTPTPTPTPAPTTPAQTGVKPAIGETCGEADACAKGLECVKYYGIAGPRGPQFKSCEQRCEGKKASCPSGTKCVTVADGPGQVCRP